MNKLQAKPLIQQKITSSPKSRSSTIYSPSTITLSPPFIIPKKKVRACPKKITNTKEAFICYGIGCLALGGVIGLFSSLAGHTLLEQSRRDQIRTKEKVTHLKREIGQLKSKIDEIKYHESIDRWAESKGMINDRLIQPKAEDFTPSNLLKDAYVASF